MDPIESKLIQAVILLDRQYRMIVRLTERLAPVLEELELAIPQKTVSLDLVLDAYNYALTLIDNLERYRKTAFSIPRLNRKSPEYRDLAHALGNIKDARNQLQHLNNDIENSNTGPLLGGVSWVSNQQEYSVLLHDVGRARSSPGIVFDTKTDAYTMKFCFTYGDSYFDLAQALAGVRAFNAFVLSYVHIEIDGKPYRAENHFMAYRMSFQRVDTAPAETDQPTGKHPSASS